MFCMYMHTLINCCNCVQHAYMHWCVLACACYCVTKAHRAIFWLPVESVLENHKFVTWHGKFSALCAQFVQHTVLFWINYLPGFCSLSQWLWRNTSCNRHTGTKKRNRKDKRKKVDREPMDTADENCSQVTVANAGEFNVELLHSLFTQVL